VLLIEYQNLTLPIISQIPRKFLYAVLAEMSEFAGQGAECFEHQVEEWQSVVAAVLNGSVEVGVFEQ
jgi:hypothetical protein